MLINIITFITTFALIIKILFLLSTIIYYISSTKITNKKSLYILTYIREITEFVFIFSMSLLLIIIFFPRKNNVTYINKENSILFFALGIILIISADWSLFFEENIILQKLKTRIR